MCVFGMIHVNPKKMFIKKKNTSERTKTFAWYSYSGFLDVWCLFMRLIRLLQATSDAEMISLLSPLNSTCYTAVVQTSYHIKEKNKWWVAFLLQSSGIQLDAQKMHWMISQSLGVTKSNSKQSVSNVLLNSSIFCCNRFLHSIPYTFTLLLN